MAPQVRVWLAATMVAFMVGSAAPSLAADALPDELALSDIAASVSDHPRFSGAHLEADKLIISSTDGDVGMDLDPREGSVVTREVTYAASELRNTAGAIVEGLGKAKKAGFEVTSVSQNPRSNRVDVGVLDDAKTAATCFQDAFGEIVHVKRMPRRGFEFLTCAEDDCGSKGGLVIKKGVTCSSRFLVRARPQHGEWKHYILTAGHCIANSGGTQSTARWRNGANTLEWGRSKAVDFWEQGNGGFLNLG